MPWQVWLLSLGFGLGSAVAAASAADKPDAAAPAESSSPVAATVNGKPIRIDELEEAMAPALVGRKLSPPAMAQLQAEALSQMIDRRLVERSVSAGGKEVTEAEIDDAQTKLETQLEAQKITLEQLLAERHLTREALRKQLSWQILWARTMDKQLTDSVLEDYFDDHKKEFDGTEVRASHILLRPARTADPTAMVELLKQAKAIRDKIEAGTYTFEEAAGLFSAGPSREKGGDVGFFPRHGLMVEPFCRTAFALPIGEISQPLTTPFGVHLIKVTEIKDGKKPWTDAREQLKPPAAQALFEKIAKLQREKAKIQFTGAWPYFKPDTHDLVMPEN